MKCENCGHGLMKRRTVNGFLWVHIRPEKTKLGNKFVYITDYDCSCGCMKPEPDVSEVRNQVAKK